MYCPHGIHLMICMCITTCPRFSVKVTKSFYCYNQTNIFFNDLVAKWLRPRPVWCVVCWVRALFPGHATLFSMGVGAVPEDILQTNEVKLATGPVTQKIAAYIYMSRCGFIGLVIVLHVCISFTVNNSINVQLMFNDCNNQIFISTS